MAALVTEVAALRFAGIAAGWDARSGGIPNPLVLVGAVCVEGLALEYGGLPGLLDAAAGLGVGLGLGLIPFALGWLGDGDVKLLAALGAFAALPRVLVLGGATALAGGVLALLWIGRFGLLRRGARAATAPLAPADAPDGPDAYACGGRGPRSGIPPMPYALAMAAGTAAVFVLPGWLR